MDRLSTLLSQFGVRANLFYNGTLCGMVAYDDSDQRGHLHLLQKGAITLKNLDGADLFIERPSLIFLPRPSHYQMISSSEHNGVQLLCASIVFDGGTNNPISNSLPDLTVLPLDELPLLADTLTWLFKEAADEHCGREAVLDRLFEILVILLFRHLLDHQQLSIGVMAGLADVRLFRSLIKMQNEPQRNWSVAELATVSNMSRAAYALHFRSILGQTPADYLLSWRISLAQKYLCEGRPMTLIANDVGYESPSALSRAFRRKTGYSPRNWMKSVVGEDTKSQREQNRKP